MLSRDQLQDDEAAPNPVASASDRSPRPPKARSMRARGTHACTIPESRKPRTSAHQTSHAIWNAFQSPCAIWSTPYSVARRRPSATSTAPVAASSARRILERRKSAAALATVAA